MREMYGVVFHNYLKNTAEVAVFDRKEDAKQCWELMQGLNPEEAEAVSLVALKNCVGYEEDLPLRCLAETNLYGFVYTAENGEKVICDKVHIANSYIEK